MVESGTARKRKEEDSPPNASPGPVASYSLSLRLWSFQAPRRYANVHSSSFSRLCCGRCCERSGKPSASGYDINHAIISIFSQSSCFVFLITSLSLSLSFSLSLSLPTFNLFSLTRASQISISPHLYLLFFLSAYFFFSLFPIYSHHVFLSFSSFCSSIFITTSPPLSLSPRLYFHYPSVLYFNLLSFILFHRPSHFSPLFPPPLFFFISFLISPSSILLSLFILSLSLSLFFLIPLSLSSLLHLNPVSLSFLLNLILLFLSFIFIPLSFFSSPFLSLLSFFSPQSDSPLSFLHFHPPLFLHFSIFTPSLFLFSSI
ncbi:unnamed protein product [Acanthosepion pharaonis]|uniref:Uncharacterized protein n=1 Tax=Acanthosepion pharaonis TaxID=158019 RepID=A0A812ANA6_ACAPH|nr:unnamed protein product [Sepia pharaonis]